MGDTSDSRLTTNIGGRRFITVLGACVLTTLLTWFGKLPPAVYEMVVITVVLAYLGANTLQKIKAPGVPG